MCVCACKDTLVSRVILSHIWHTNACVIEREGIFMAFKARLCFLVLACSWILIIIKFHAAVVTMCFSAALWPNNYAMLWCCCEERRRDLEINEPTLANSNIEVEKYIDCQCDSFDKHCYGHSGIFTHHAVPAQKGNSV